MNYGKVFGFLTLIFSLCGILFYQTNLKTEYFAKKRLSMEVGQDGYYVRHCTTNKILGQVPSGLQTIPFHMPPGRSPEMAANRQSAFQHIFKNRTWVPTGEHKNKEQASGPGSTLDYAQETIAGLHAIISQLKRDLGVDRIRLLDIPCGDMVWMSRFLKTRDDVDYTGFDIVPDLIDRHRKNFANQTRWKFRVQDIVRDGLKESFDLILCRMMLQHLFNHDALTVVKHFSESRSRFLLTTSFNREQNNSELVVVNARFRLLNLERPPFSLAPPVCVLRDGEEDDPHGQNHFLGLWQLPVRSVKFCQPSSPFLVKGFGVDFYSCTKWS